MKQVNKLSFPDNKFDLYFLAYDSPQAVSSGHHWSDREGILELTHNYGSEHDDNFKVANGNSEPGKGFGHLCVSVDNIQAACQRIEDAGYKFQKKLTDGRMRSIAFALDPDGYWVEIIGQNPMDKTEGVKETKLEKYRFVRLGDSPGDQKLRQAHDIQNHTMIRVKSAEASLKFYQEVMGMTLMRTSENKDNGFNLYFLGYPGSKGVPTESANGVNPVADREGLLELTWNYGTGTLDSNHVLRMDTDSCNLEKDESFKYHDGNSEPQGFGHICKQTLF